MGRSSPSLESRVWPFYGDVRPVRASGSLYLYWFGGVPCVSCRVHRGGATTSEDTAPRRSWSCWPETGAAKGWRCGAVTMWARKGVGSGLVWRPSVLSCLVEGDDHCVMVVNVSVFGRVSRVEVCGIESGTLGTREVGGA